MVLRVATLARALRCAAAVLAAATAAAAQGELDTRPGLESEVLEFDAVLQADLDALLADPVVLDAHAGLERLQVLPWLDAAALAVLSQALPVENLDALAALPPWDAARVRRLAPFVQPAPLAAQRSGPVWRVVSGARPDQLDLRVERGPLRAVVRQPGRGPLAVRGALQWSSRRGGFAAGGLRATQGLGLVMGPHAWGTDASAAIQPLVVPAQRSVARVPWLQGAAMHTSGGGLAVYAGRGAAGALQAVSLGGAHVRASVVHAGSAWRSGALLRIGAAGEWAAAEVARGPEGVAFAIAAQARAGNLEIASRADARPDGWAEAHGAGSAASAGAVQGNVRWRNASTVLSARAARGWRPGGGDVRSITSLQALEMSLRAAGCVFDALWTGRGSATDEVAGMDAVQRDRRRESWGLRAARAQARRALVLDLRRWHDTARDQAWQVQWSMGAARRRVTLALAGFTVSHSRALGLPVAGTAADSRLRGRGMRLAGGVHGAARGVELRALVAALASAERGWEVQAHAAVGLRLP